MISARRIPILAISRWRALRVCDGSRDTERVRAIAIVLRSYSICRAEGLQRITAALSLRWWHLFAIGHYCCGDLFCLARLFIGPRADPASSAAFKRCCYLRPCDAASLRDDAAFEAISRANGALARLGGRRIGRTHDLRGAGDSAIEMYACLCDSGME